MTLPGAETINAGISDAVSERGLAVMGDMRELPEYERLLVSFVPPCNLNSPSVVTCNPFPFVRAPFVVDGVMIINVSARLASSSVGSSGSRAIYAVLAKQRAGCQGISEYSGEPVRISAE